MTELERLQAAIARQYECRPRSAGQALFIASRDYLEFDRWASELETLRSELNDLCEGRRVCNHPVGAIVQNPVTRDYHCDLCGKELKK